MRRLDPVVLGILAFSLVAGLLVVARTWEYGIGLSPDSVAYVSMARELATGHGAMAGEHLRPMWPPLFTLLLSAPGVAGVDPIAVGAFLNPVILVCICLIAGLWLYRRTGSGFMGIVVTATLAFSIPLTRVSSFVWTEPLFVLLTVCSLVLLDRHLRDDSIMALVFAAMFAALRLPYSIRRCRTACRYVAARVLQSASGTQEEGRTDAGLFGRRGTAVVSLACKELPTGRDVRRG